jgi:CheY-like chemotaxis protein
MSTTHEILLVDDNSADVKLLTDFFLPSVGACHFTVTVDGEQALHYVHRQGHYSQHPVPRVIILDLNLPRKSGTEVLTEIRSKSELLQVPVVVLSGSDDPKDKAECFSLGANHFLTKPSNLDGLEGLFTVIQEYLRQKDTGLK